MSKISFNPKALGTIVTTHDSDVIKANATCAFVPVVVLKPGIEAIYEGLRLADIERFKPVRDLKPDDRGTACI